MVLSCMKDWLTCYSNSNLPHAERNPKYSYCLLCKMREHVFTEWRPNLSAEFHLSSVGIFLHHPAANSRVVYMTLTLLNLLLLLLCAVVWGMLGENPLFKQVRRGGAQHLRFIAQSAFRGQCYFQVYFTSFWQKHLLWAVLLNADLQRHMALELCGCFLLCLRGMGHLNCLPWAVF